MAVKISQPMNSLASGLPAFSLKCSDQAASCPCQDPPVTRGRNIKKRVHRLPLKGLPLGTPVFWASVMVFRSQSLSPCVSLPLLGFLPKQAGRLPLCGSTTILTSPCLYPLTDPLQSEKTRKYFSQWPPERLMEVYGWSHRDHMLISEDGVP